MNAGFLASMRNVYFKSLISDSILPPHSFFRAASGSTFAARRAGRLTNAQWHELHSKIVRSPGHCMTMGTASTLAVLAEVLGLALPERCRIAPAEGPAIGLAGERRLGSVALHAPSFERTTAILRGHA